MNRAKKVELANQLKEKFKKSQVILFADYKGLKANQADQLRKLLRSENTEVKVIKNSVARLVTKDGFFGQEAKDLMDGIVGPTLVAYSFSDPVAPTKIFYDFAQSCEAFQIKESLFEQKKISVLEVEALAKLPSKEVLLSQLLSTLQGPMRNLLTVLTGVQRSFLYLLSALEEKKEKEK
jgi:large subunit ribosomal protein L10